MKSRARVQGYSVSVFYAALLGGCAAGSGPMGHEGMSGSHAEMDMQAMCDMHKKMMGGASSAEQQAMMNEHMKSMSPETRARMQAMHEKCNAS